MQRRTARSALVTIAAVVAMVLTASACDSRGQSEIEVSGTLLEAGDWQMQLDEESAERLDSGEAHINVSFTTRVRCRDGARVTQRDLQAGWSVDVVASGVRGEDIPTLSADEVRVGCQDEPGADS